MKRLNILSSRDPPQFKNTKPNRIRRIKIFCVATNFKDNETGKKIFFDVALMFGLKP